MSNIMSALLSDILHAGGARSALIRKNILAGFAIKAWSALTVLLTVPLTLQCLGIYENGIWLTISSILVWIDMLDIGLGNGLRNQLTIDLAHNDMQRARQTVSSTFAMLAFIIVVTLAVLLCIIGFADDYQMLNVDPAQVSHLPVMLALAVTLVCITFVFKVVGNVYMSHQLPAISNLLVATGQTLALLATFILYMAGQATLLSVLLVNTASPLLVYLVGFIYTFWFKYPELRPHFHAVNLSVAKQLMSLSFQFFAIQIASVVLFFSGNLIITHLYTPELVNPYQITYRYFSLVLILFTVICVPFWNATADAYSKGDMSWIHHASHQMRVVLLTMTSLLIIMVIASPWVYAVWIGDKVSIPISLSIAMACYIAILISSMRYSYFLNGIGALRLQLFVSITAAVIFIPLAKVAAMISPGVTSFVAVLCLVNIPGLIVNHIQFNRIIKGKAHGLWKR